MILRGSAYIISICSYLSELLKIKFCLRITLDVTLLPQTKVLDLHSHTLTRPSCSNPIEHKILLLGENVTQLTPNLWPFNSARTCFVANSKTKTDGW